MAAALRAALCSGLLLCVSGMVPEPRNVRITSVNLQSTLQWDAPRFPRGNITYTVQSKSHHWPPRGEAEVGVRGPARGCVGALCRARAGQVAPEAVLRLLEVQDPLLGEGQQGHRASLCFLGVTPVWIIVTALVGSMLVVGTAVTVCFFSSFYLYRLSKHVFCPSYIFPQHLKEQSPVTSVITSFNFRKVSEEENWPRSAVPEQPGLWKVSLAMAGTGWEELWSLIQPKPFWESVILWSLKIPAKRRAGTAAIADGDPLPLSHSQKTKAAAGSLPRNKGVHNAPVPACALLSPCSSSGASIFTHSELSTPRFAADFGS
ncbi:interleukin-10 receptor subunit beta isoform X5 [Anomalospiza imberbis]|uniref:interleukin-10 receptor subunit beta isoform X5 n=1 Tax=Anomalospiza imberbis TaxID=187417 RepID=UPI00358F0B2B